MVCGQTGVPGLGRSNVPLSCVPPCRSFELAGFTERLWNWIVSSPTLRLTSCLGTRDSSCWHRVRSLPTSERKLHREEVLEKTPSDRTTPPSEPSKNWLGLAGFVTSTCWSGWSPCGLVGEYASSVMSVQLTPASVESTTPRPLETFPG